MNELRILSQEIQTEFPVNWFDIINENHFWCRARYENFICLVNSLAIPLNSFLKGMDIATGNGLVRFQLEKSTEWIIDGVDISRETLERNVARKGINYLYNIHDKHSQFEKYYGYQEYL